MNRSFYTSVTALITQEKRQTNILNNISNANTTSYKKDEIIVKSFKESLIKELDNNKTIGKLSLGASIDGMNTEYTQGDLKETNNNLNFAIEGRGFFVIRNESNNYYTRDGNFKINSKGYLTNDDGDYVIGINKTTNNEEPIYIGNNEFTLNEDNSISIDNISNYTIKTVDFNNYNELTKIGNNNYIGENPIENSQTTIKQGYLENSNVNIIEEMTNMMTTMRNFETNQKILQLIDDTLGQAANEIGKI